MPRKKTEFINSCPFCGSDPEIVPWHGGGRHKHRIGCVDEQCPTAPSATAATRSKAIALWNQRSLDGLRLCRDLHEMRDLESRLKAAAAECKRLRKERDSWKAIVNPRRRK